MRSSLAFNIFTCPQASTSIIEADFVSLRGLILQASANVIYACENYPTGEKIPRTGATAVLARYTQWTSQGHINSLQDQVALVHQVAQALAENPAQFGSVFLLDAHQTVPIITDALQAYQNLKTRICKEEEEAHGIGYGKGTNFYKMDWTSHNAALLKLTQAAQFAA